MKKLFSLLIIFQIIACASKPDFESADVDSTPPEVFDLTFSLERLPLESRAIFPSISVVAVGDIMLGNHTVNYIQEFGSSYPFAATDSILLSGDITIGNLEGPFAVTGEPFEKRFTFKVPPQFASSLAEAGFDVMTLANNHILDFGMSALNQTIDVLDSLGIEHCGAGGNRSAACEPAILEIDGFKIAVFGYSMTFPEEFWASDSSGGTCFPYEKVVERTIAHYDSTCDIVIANFHWGRELKNSPRDYQIETAHRVIDLGADLVIGHHPHVLQGVEVYKNRLIAYSLGNFCFSSYSKRAVESVILKVQLDKSGFIFARVIPINVNNYEVEFQPRPFDRERAAEVISHLNEFSMNLEHPAIFDSSGFLITELLTTGKIDSVLDAARICSQVNN